MGEDAEERRQRTAALWLSTHHSQQNRIADLRHYAEIVQPDGKQEKRKSDM